jgi:hypothetical protein
MLIASKKRRRCCVRMDVVAVVVGLVGCCWLGRLVWLVWFGWLMVVCYVIVIVVVMFCTGIPLVLFCWLQRPFCESLLKHVESTQKNGEWSAGPFIVSSSLYSSLSRD